MIGRRMRVELLTAVALEVPDVAEQVRELVEKGFFETAVDDDGHPVVFFHHALILDAAYGRLLRRTRREMHLRVAEIGEELYGVSDENIDLLARHYYLGEAGEKAVPYLVQAGERAKRLFANDEAILQFSRAVELAPDDREVKLQLADLHELVGSYEEALRLYEEVRDAAPGVHAFRGIAATRRKRGEYNGGARHPRGGLPDRRAEGRGPDGALVGAGEDARARRASARGVRRSPSRDRGRRRPARRRASAQLLFQLARAQTVQGEFEEALEHALEAKSIFERAVRPARAREHDARARRHVPPPRPARRGRRRAAQGPRARGARRQRRGDRRVPHEPRASSRRPAARTRRRLPASAARSTSSSRSDTRRAARMPTTTSPTCSRSSSSTRRRCSTATGRSSWRARSDTPARSPRPTTRWRRSRSRKADTRRRSRKAEEAAALHLELGRRSGRGQRARGREHGLRSGRRRRAGPLAARAGPQPDRFTAASS